MSRTFHMKKLFLQPVFTVLSSFMCTVNMVSHFWIVWFCAICRHRSSNFHTEYAMLRSMVTLTNRFDISLYQAVAHHQFPFNKENRPCTCHYSHSHPQRGARVWFSCYRGWEWSRASVPSNRTRDNVRYIYSTFSSAFVLMKNSGL